MCVLGKRIRCTQGKFYSNWWKLGTSEMKIKWNKKKEQKTTKRNSQANGKGVCACVGVCLYAIWSHKNRAETLKLSAKMQKRVKDVKTKAYIIIRYRYNKKQWCAMLNTLHMVKVYYFSPIRQTNQHPLNMPIYIFTIYEEMKIQHRYKTHCLFTGS